MVEYLNADKHPDSHEITDKYTHININSTTKKARRQYKKELRKKIK